MAQFGQVSNADWVPGAEKTVITSGAAAGSNIAVVAGSTGQYPIQPDDTILDIQSSASGVYMPGSPSIIAAELVECDTAGYIKIPTVNTTGDTLEVRFISSLFILNGGQ